MLTAPIVVHAKVPIHSPIPLPIVLITLSGNWLRRLHVGFLNRRFDLLLAESKSPVDVLNDVDKEALWLGDISETF